MCVFYLTITGSCLTYMGDHPSEARALTVVTDSDTSVTPVQVPKCSVSPVGHPQLLVAVTQPRSVGLCWGHGASAERQRQGCPR